MSAALLSIRSLCKRFGSNVAVKDVSFDIGAGDIFGLIGPNGSGKTTTFNMISGFLKPTGGEVLLDGKAIQGQAPHRIVRQGVVRTFQLIQVYRDLTVLDNVLAGHHLRRHGLARMERMSEAAIRDNAFALLVWLGLDKHAGSRASDLPAGLQRMLSVASALACRPRMLLLDEPLAGLNPSEKALFADKIAELPGQQITVLLVEHDVKSVMKLCNRIAVINFGQKIAEGGPQAISSNPDVIKAYLGH